MLDNRGAAGRTHGEIDIEATPAAIMDVIADLANYPLWSEGVTGAVVLSEQGGRPATARLTFSSGPLTDEFELAYDWHGTESVDWHMITPGEVLRRQDGTYTLTHQADGTVRVAYDLEVELSIPIIGKLKARAEKLIIKAALEGLKARVESLTRVTHDQGSS